MLIKTLIINFLIIFCIIYLILRINWLEIGILHQFIRGSNLQINFLIAIINITIWSLGIVKTNWLALVAILMISTVFISCLTLEISKLGLILGFFHLKVLIDFNVEYENAIGVLARVARLLRFALIVYIVLFLLWLLILLSLWIEQFEVINRLLRATNCFLIFLVLF